MPEQISEEEKERRRDEIMELQQQIVFGKSKNQIGKVLSVMVEGRLPEEDVYIARSYMDAPDVDGYVFFHSDWNLMSGEFLDVRITETNGYDLIGECI